MRKRGTHVHLVRGLLDVLEVRFFARADQLDSFFLGAAAAAPCANANSVAASNTKPKMPI